MPKYLATTVRGLEDVAAEEVAVKLNVKPEEGVSRISFEAPLEAVFKLNLESRLLHRVILVVDEGYFETLEEIERKIEEVDFTPYIEPDQTFAVRAVRVGEHTFTSLDVAAKVGRALIESYRSSRNVKLKVNLENPDLEFRCLVSGRRYILGLDTTGESLHKRGYRVYDHPAALRTTIAAGMVRLSGWKPGEPLLDPMCGGGTIPVEAALTARRIPPGVYRRSFAFEKFRFLDLEAYRELRSRLLGEVDRTIYPILGFDTSPRSLEGAARNADSAGVSDTVKFTLSDALNPRSYRGLEVKRIVVNPPYGLRAGPSLRKIKTFYRKFLEAVSENLSDLTLTVITGSPSQFREAVEELGLTHLWARQVMHGRLQTVVYHIEVG